MSSFVRGWKSNSPKSIRKSISNGFIGIVHWSLNPGRWWKLWRGSLYTVATNSSICDTAINFSLQLQTVLPRHFLRGVSSLSSIGLDGIFSLEQVVSGAKIGKGILMSFRLLKGSLMALAWLKGHLGEFRRDFHFYLAPSYTNKLSRTKYILGFTSKYTQRYSDIFSESFLPVELQTLISHDLW